MEANYNELKGEKIRLDLIQKLGETIKKEIRFLVEEYAETVPQQGQKVTDYDIKTRASIAQRLEELSNFEIVKEIVAPELKVQNIWDLTISTDDNPLAIKDLMCEEYNQLHPEEQKPSPGSPGP